MILLLRSAIGDRLYQFLPSGHTYSGHIYLGIDRVSVEGWTTTSQSNPPAIFRPMQDPEALTNGTGATVKFSVHYKFEFDGTRRWEILQGVDFQQFAKFDAPPAIPDGPAAPLSFNETAPVDVPPEPKKYDKVRDIEVGPGQSIVVTPGVDIVRPSGTAQGVLRLGGNATFDATDEHGLTRTATLPLDRFFRDAPHPSVTVLDLGVIGVIVEVRYFATEALLDRLYIRPSA